MVVVTASAAFNAGQWGTVGKYPTTRALPQVDRHENARGRASHRAALHARYRRRAASGTLRVSVHQRVQCLSPCPGGRALRLPPGTVVAV